MRQAIEVADILDAPMFTIVGHQVVDGIDQPTSVRNIERALAGVVPMLEAAGRTAILEPFNPVDHQGHFLNGSSDALAICRSIDSPAVKINWDLYHMQLTEGNLIASLRAGIDQVGYVQIADVPGRHQPGTGEINYTHVFAALDHLGYKGPIGLECWPEDGDAQRAIADLLATVA
jgi:hydroxypyruvate isomerase